MTCFLVDDQVLINAKMAEAIEIYGGPAVFALWVAVGTTCGAGNSEGVIAPGAVAGAARTLIILDPEQCTKALVTVRLWHDGKTLRRCERCREHLASNDIDRLPKGGFLFHDWGQQQFSRMEAKDPVARSKRNRRKALHRLPDLIRAIRARDGDRCRYCNVEVNFRARTGGTAGTYDHVNPECWEPNGGNFLEAIVVACARCNADKSDRTPEEWVAVGGMPLLPVPDRRSGNSNPPVSTGQDHGQAVLALTGAGARMGPGQEGPGPGQTVGSGTGPDASNPHRSADRTSDDYEDVPA